MNINIYDLDLNRISIIESNYISCLWEEGYNTVENFILELNAIDEYKKKIKLDFYVGRSDRETLMVIKSIQVSDNKIIISGKQCARVLSDVAFIGTIEANSLVDKSIATAYNNSRKYKNLEFDDTDLGITYPSQISNKSVLSLCETMCQETDTGFRAVKKNDKIILQFYKPKEKENLIFSENFGNLFIGSILRSTESFKDYAIVLGEGEGENRKIVNVDISNGEWKKEIIVDAKDLQMEEGEREEQYFERLRARGLEKLLENRNIFSCSFNPNVEDFGSRYDLGDILTIHLLEYGLKLQSRVSRFSEKSQENRTEITVEVGNIIIKR